MSKEITIPVPDGKRAEWINGVLTLVDEQKVENRPVTERIKTLDDACNALGDEHPLVTQYLLTAAAYKGDPMTEDFIAYLKLRIIVAALNEGWEPKFTEDEYRYFPWFYFYTKEEYDKLDDEEKGRCVLRSGVGASASCGFVYVSASSDASYSSTNGGSRLAFRTRELAAYAGRQFTEEWADFMFKPRTGEELNGKSEVAKTTIDFNNNEDE
ncbi:MAG: hypothetical protein [Bacteriophage sp.]|nr:MAG: hypothetical protein [Bacteriophage sp.]